jgi:hypothetical protein
MSRGRIIIWSLLVVGVALVALAWFSFREPRAGGEPLSYWLEQGIKDASSQREKRSSAEVEAAIREIGPKAIPILLARLRYVDSPWRESVHEWVNKQDVIQFKRTREQDNWLAGIYGFGVLGTSAVSALPELEQIFNNTNTTWGAGMALAQIGVQALPVLRAAFTNPSPQIRSVALQSTRETNLALATLPDMRLLQDDPEDHIATEARWRLMRHSSREEATKVAIETIQSKRAQMRNAMLRGWRGVNLDTNQIVPLLVSKLTDPDREFRRVVTNAFIRLDPVAAAAAGINTNPPSILSGRGGRRTRGPAGTNNPAPPQQ